MLQRDVYIKLFGGNLDISKIEYSCPRELSSIGIDNA